jgi:tRNA A-37 threonylcarbamoyl transferase component Bud32/ligand-binding sensor domain-containing protein
MPLGRGLGLLAMVAAVLPAQQYPFIEVPHSPRNIEHILQDRKGRLWISTHDDLLCFDGDRFFSLREFGFPPLMTGALAEDQDGAILSVSSRGIYRFLQGHLEHILPDIPVSEAMGAAPGVLLASISGDQPSLYRIRRVQDVWRAEQITSWKAGPSFTRDRTGAILAVCPGGWCEVPAKKVMDGGAGLDDRVFHPSSLDFVQVLRDRFGCLWFRSMEAARYQCPGDAEPVSLPASIAGRNFWSSETETDDGAMLFASAGSLAIGRPGSFQVVSPAGGLPAEAITCAVRARDGTIWVGSIGGLYRFPYPFRMTHWKSRLGLFWSFAKSAGTVFAGTGAGVARLSKDGEWKVLPGSREFGSVSSLLPAPDGSLWAAVSREGVIRLRPDGTLDARTPPQQGGKAELLARTADGSIWLAGSEIYQVLQKGRDLTLNPANPPGERPTNAVIGPDSRGGLWACFAGNLLHWDAGEWQTAARDGLSLPGPCRSLAVAAGGDIWAGYNGEVVVVHRNGQGTTAVRAFPSGGDTGNAISFSFDSDMRGWLWRGAPDGIYVADQAQAQRGVWLHLSEIDGLTDVNVNHHSLYSDPDGSIWWAAAASIVHFFPPPDLVHPALPPAVFLSAVSVNGAPPRLAESLPALPAGSKLIVHLGSLQFTGRNAMSVRYRWLPEQRDWRESASLNLDLGSPGWGTHRLEVQSRFSTGQWSPTWSGVLVAARPWWLSWPAMLAFAGIGSGGAVWGARWRRKRKIRAQNNLPDLAGWRMAALTPESQLAGTTLDGRFQVLGLVARGGFATVIKGRDLRSGQPCAVKVFRREVVDEQWLTHRFQQEVSALEQIRHPSVVSIYGHGIAPFGIPYLVMEFIEGGTLRELLDGGPLTLDRAASLLWQAAGALEQIHANGIYHRDLKPENLMLRRGAPADKDLVLIDFSIALVKEPDQTIHGLSRAAGTIYYMAPEQAIGFATAATDIYSLAKVLLEMLTGQRLSLLLPNASMDLPQRVRELVRGLPIRLSEESVELLGSALEFDPARRPQAAQRFARPIVRDLQASSDPAASPCPSPKDGGPAAGSIP